jgi:hypothetical protein
VRSLARAARAAAAGWVALAGAGALHAQSLTIVPDASRYAIGETVTATIVGDTAALSDTGIFAQLRFDPAMLGNASVTRNLVPPPMDGTLSIWFNGPLECGADYCDVIDSATTIPRSIEQTGSNAWATVTFTALAPGTTELRFEDAAPGETLDFFELDEAPPAVAIEVFSAVPLASPIGWAALAAGLLLVARRARC